MSHFTVLVIGDNPEEQLAPYQENNMSDCPKEYLEFNDTEDEYREKYETESSEMVELPSGKLVDKWDDMFKVPGKIGYGNDSHKIPKEFKIVKVRHSTRYKTFEEFMREYGDYEKRDETTNRYGYWENPNRKWDWYTLGGRWTGFFKVKKGHTGILGKPGVFDNAPQEGYCDSLKYGDIDFEGMRADARKEAEERFDKVMAVIGNRTFPSWTSLKETWGQNNIKDAREEYNNNEVVKDLEAARLMPFLNDIHSIYCNFNKEEYLKKCEDDCIITHAVIYKGKWYENGEMGWWGIINGDDDSKWLKEYRKLLDGLSPDTLLSVYDCHI